MLDYDEKQQLLFRGFGPVLFILKINTMNTFIQQWCIKMNSIDSKDINCYQIYLFRINTVLLNFLFLKDSWKSCF